MISIYKIKPKFQDLLMPVLDLFYKLGFTANHITIASVVLSAVIGLCFWFSDVYPVLFLSLPIGLFIRMALNALDGMMARIHNQQSKLGEVLNEIGDIIADLIIFFPLVKYESGIIYLIILFLCLSIINEFAGVLGKLVSGERRYDGPMGKSDRAFVIGIYGILAYAGVNLSSYSVYIFSVIVILILISTFLRLKKSLK